MRIIKRYLLMGILLTALLLSGCNEPAPRILVVTTTSLDQGFVQLQERLQQWAAERDAQVELTAPTLPTAAEQQAVLEQALQQRWDVICIEPLGGDELAPLLEYAKDQGSVVVTVRGDEIATATYNINPFSPSDMGQRIIDTLSGIMHQSGMYITMLPGTGDAHALEIEQAAVEQQKVKYGGMFAVCRLIETEGSAQMARKLLKQSVEKYRIEGVLFLSTNDGLGIASGEDDLSAVGIGDIRRLGDAVNSGDIDALFYWDSENLILSAVQMGYSAAQGKTYRPGDIVNLNLEGYEALRYTEHNTWVAKDIRVATS